LRRDEKQEIIDPLGRRAFLGAGALTIVGYRGTATVELDGGDAAHLRDLSHRMDLIPSGANR
jgi:hypothetical protein